MVHSLQTRDPPSSSAYRRIQRGSGDDPGRFL